jgi:hypothetical protein
MKALVTRTAASARLRRVGIAAVLAAATMLGTTTGALGDPAAACAKPKFDEDLYHWCASGVLDRMENGEYTTEEAEQIIEDCGNASNGEWVVEVNGVADCWPPEEGPGRHQVPFPGNATATMNPAPPPGPVVVLPNLPPAQAG